jgi:hypothetical protein
MCKEQPRMFACLYLRSVWSALLFYICLLMLSLQFVCYNEDMERCHMAGPPPQLPRVMFPLLIYFVPLQSFSPSVHIHVAGDNF